MRAAVYYAPEVGDGLAEAAARWLGRDPETGAVLAQPDIPGIAEVTGEPRRYGFHATLKPPFRLALGWDALVADATALAARLRPFDLPPLAVQDVHGFLALRESVPSPELQALADACVVELDAHRVPPDDAELARRRGKGLAPEHDAMLLRWGYPYVLSTWFFHMTLTRRLSAEERARFMPAAEAYFAEAIARPRRVSRICLFTQAAPDRPFLVALRLKLRG
jgi:putative phosphonate metabolism protein